LLQRGTRQDDSLQHVRKRKDAKRLLSGIDDHHRPQVAVGHQGNDLANRCLRRHGNRFPLDNRGEWRIHRLLLGSALGKLQLQLLLRVLEQAGDVLAAEEIENRALLGQGKEVVGRQFVAENLLACHVGTRSGVTLRHQRPDREGLTRAERARRRVGVTGAAAGADSHPAVLQNVEGARNPHLTRENPRTFGVMGKGDMFCEKAQRLRLHTIKRRVGLQELDACRNQHFRRAVAHTSSSIATTGRRHGWRRPETCFCGRACKRSARSPGRSRSAA
jgi:hypothetical protein